MKSLLPSTHKSQLLAQPFIFIFTLIVAALILFFGTKAIIDFKTQSELAELITFVTDLKNNGELYYNFDKGSSKQLNIPLPNKIKRVCITNPSQSLSTTDQDLLDIANPTHNLYIFPYETFMINQFKIPYLEPITNPLCIQTSGKFKATIETKAHPTSFYVEIRQ